MINCGACNKKSQLTSTSYTPQNIVPIPPLDLTYKLCNRLGLIARREVRRRNLKCIRLRFWQRTRRTRLDYFWKHRIWEMRRRRGGIAGIYYVGTDPVIQSSTAALSRTLWWSSTRPCCMSNKKGIGHPRSSECRADREHNDAQQRERSAIRMQIVVSHSNM